ncbi:purine-nucleoside phosphorylase [uncultured Ezakiella sp.]|uniref:purine-nucleoside phosphorylase n=1 Tax=uncultured Ezakiella sp. TaxID=1637529 RepID=UPI0025F64523|nr:purine-nucleoside phosphorylase [uncultured Ezakiella sp.]
MSENILYDKLKSVYEDLRRKIDFKPELAITLGSGLGRLADIVEIEEEISYQDIEGFPVSTAPGHKGRFVFAHIHGVPTVIMQGRVHRYEGYSAADTVLPTRLMGMMGAKTLIVTNACGGVNKDFRIGDLMIIRDHIAQFVESPLTGPNINQLGVRFPDMTEVYNKELSDRIEKIAKEKNLPVKNGVYCQFSGPAYETAAEVKMAGILGADAVGMSTAIEAMAARHMGMNVCGISLITNLATGISEVELSEQEVIDEGEKASEYFIDLVLDFIKTLK